MHTLLEDIEKHIPKNLQLPWELKELLIWIEEKGYYKDTSTGKIGFLHDPEIDENGSWVKFHPELNSSDLYIFDSEEFAELDVSDRFHIICQTGGDGSIAALWLNDANEQKIVHVGSGSGSGLLCVLAEAPLDFIRLLAIGYDEVSSNEYFEEAPNNPVNVEFQDWVQNKFKTTIPKTASEIVKVQSELWDEKSNDDFHSWFVTYNKNYI